jgi:hypothetical protein
VEDVSGAWVTSPRLVAGRAPDPAGLGHVVVPDVHDHAVDRVLQVVAVVHPHLGLSAAKAAVDV